MPVTARALKVITRIFMYISYLAISVLAVMTVVDVVRRTVFGMTLAGVTEYSQMLLIVSMTAMAHALVEGRFINVGILVDRFPKAVNLFIEVFMGVVSFAFFVLVGTQLFRQIGFSRAHGESYFMIGVVKWPMFLALGASFFACALATIVFVYERIVNFKDPGEKTLFDDNPDLAILALSADDGEDGNIGKGGAE